MKTLWIGLCAMLATALALAPPGAAATDAPSGQARAEQAGRGLVGSLAPALAMKTIDGHTIDLASLYGRKAVYLKFWASWCVPCRQQMPHLEHTFETAGPDLAVIAINIGVNDSLTEVEAVRRQAGLRMPIVIDNGRLAAAFNLRVTPQHVVIGRDGRIEYVGHLANERLDAALVAARQVPAGSSASTQWAASGSALREGDRHDAPMDGTRRAGGAARAVSSESIARLSAVTLEGSEFHVVDPQDPRPTALVFLSTFCESYLATSRPVVAGNCRRVREQVDALAASDLEVRWLGVASGLWTTQPEVQDYAHNKKPKIPLTLDESGTLFRSFHVMNVPTIIITSSRGQIVHRVDGFDASFPLELHRLVRTERR